jgi:SAM-dependent methyltransferase
MSDMPPDLVPYYAARAAEYEAVYAKPERQRDLAELHVAIPGYFAGRRVLEVACGTGYWTRRIAPVARALTGVDLAPETLAIARERLGPASNATLVVADAYDLQRVPGQFDAAFVGFWWSHVPRAELARFLRGLHARLEPGSRVMHVDNRYVEGSNWPITRTDPNGDTFQRRQLENGDVYEVLKNFPTRQEIASAMVEAGAPDLAIDELPHYWLARYTVASR